MIFGFHRWFLYISGHTCRGNFKKYHLINYMTQFPLSIWTCQDTKLIYIFASHSFKTNIYGWWSWMSCVLCVNKFEYVTYDPPKVMVDGIVLRHTHILIQVHNNSNSRALYHISHVSGMTSCHLYSKLHCKIAIEHCSTWIKCNSCMHILNIHRYECQLSINDRLSI